MALSLDCGLDQRTRSTPGVRLPLFSVTRFTARALPLNEQVSSRCKALTLPQRPICDALTIRVCSLCTCRSHRFQLIWSQRATSAEDAHAKRSAFICVFPIRRFCLFSRQSRPAGSPPAFGREVCLPSCPPYYRVALAFSSFLYPSSYRRLLRGAFPGNARRTMGLPCFDSTTGLI